MRNKLITHIILLTIALSINAQDVNIFGDDIPNIKGWETMDPLISIKDVGNSKLITVIGSYTMENSAINFGISCGKKELVTMSSSIDLSGFEKSTLDGFEILKLGTNILGTVYIKLFEDDETKGEVIFNYSGVDPDKMDKILSQFNFKGIQIKSQKLLMK